MWTMSVVETNVVCHRYLGLAYRSIGFETDILVFDAVPKPLCEHIVTPAAFAIHTDADVPAL